MLAKVLTLTVLALATGCSTLSKNDCQTQDWHDYAKTRTLNYPQDFTKLATTARDACTEHQITPNYESLKQGYVEGLNQYCNSKNIWDKGISGQSVNLLHCPSGNRGKLQRVYNAAKYINDIEKLEEQALEMEGKVTALQQESYAIESEIDRMYRNNSSQTEIDSARQRLGQKRAEVVKQQNELASLRLKIGQMRRRAQAFNQVI